jgi:ADP-heptose:LPS heptosyltransferase
LNLLKVISDYSKRLLNRWHVFALNKKFGKKSSEIKKKTLLLLRLDSIGDYILFRNYIELLKTSGPYKDYSITLCGNSWWKELSENLDNKFIDEFMWVDYKSMLNLEYKSKIIKSIHQKGFEVLIHPTYSRDFIGDEIVKWSGAKERIGYDGDLVNLSLEQKEWNNKHYTKLIPSTEIFEFEFFRNQYFFEQILANKIQLQKPIINYPKVLENRVVIFPGAKDDFRRWSPKKFAELCDRLKSDFPNAEFTICGSVSDVGLAKEIIMQSNTVFTDYSGKLNLVELLQVIATAELVISNDSGPFHIAVALGKRVVCLSNGNNYGRFTPYPESMEVSAEVIYPEELLKFTTEKERLNRFYKHGSVLDINSIEVLDVYSSIKAEFL